MGRTHQIPGLGATTISVSLSLPQAGLTENPSLWLSVSVNQVLQKGPWPTPVGGQVGAGGTL